LKVVNKRLLVFRQFDVPRPGARLGFLLYF